MFIKDVLILILNKNDYDFTQSIFLYFSFVQRDFGSLYTKNVSCTRLMQRSLQVVIRQMFVLCSLKIEAQWSEPMSFTFHSALRKLNTEFEKRRFL